jgi:hypothetical protein
MASAAVQGTNNNDAATAKQAKNNQFANWVIPEIIEERRKRSDGKIVCNRYATGKLLGKVRYSAFYSYLHS